MEHFGPGIDLLDINTDGENVVNFTCFTEKQVSINNEGMWRRRFTCGVISLLTCP